MKRGRQRLGWAGEGERERERRGEAGRKEGKRRGWVRREG